MENFEFIEHTADIGVRVYGKSLEDLFQNCAQTLLSLLIDHKPAEKIEERIILEAETLEELLVTWLNELISLFYTYKFLPAEYDIAIEKDDKKKILRSVIKGEEFSPYENKMNREIKAATYHNLKIEKDSFGYKAEIIFDV